MSQSNISQISPPIIVKAPDNDEIEQFARSVCHAMKKRHGIPCHADAIQGLTEFMKIACCVTAKIKQKEINNGKKDSQ